MQVSVECQKRPENINPRALRRQGLIPAVLLWPQRHGIGFPRGGRKSGLNPAEKSFGK
jgi:hypothetical protein